MPSTLTTSNTINITGLAGSGGHVSVSGTGSPQISINGGAWGTSGAITNGQTLQVRLTSNASFSTMNSATVTVGTGSDQWDVTTVAQDTTPDAFSFTDQTGVAINTLTTSNSINITGITGSVSVSVSGGGSPQISINGGAWGTSGTITNGQTLQVRLTSNASFSTLNSATVTVGTGNTTWNVTSRPPPPVLQYRTTVVDTTNSLATYTFNGVDIGSSAPDRLVVVAVDMENAPTITGVTIGGVSATKTAPGGFNTEIWQALVPAGTSAQIVVTDDPSPAAPDGCIVSVWRDLTGYVSATPFDSVYNYGDGTSAGSVSANLNMSDYGVAVFTLNRVASGSTSWNAGTGRYDAVVEAANIEAADYSTTSPETPHNVIASVSLLRVGSMEHLHHGDNNVGNIRGRISHGVRGRDGHCGRPGTASGTQ